MRFHSKLTISYLLIIVLIGATTIFSIYYLTQIDLDLDELVHSNVSEISASTGIVFHVEHSLSNCRELIIEKYIQRGEEIGTASLNIENSLKLIDYFIEQAEHATTAGFELAQDDEKTGEKEELIEIDQMRKMYTRYQDNLANFTELLAANELEQAEASFEMKIEPLARNIMILAKEYEEDTLNEIKVELIELKASSNAIKNQGLLFTALALFASLILGGTIARSLNRRIGELRQATRKVASGDFRIRIPPQGSQDELADLASGFNHMVNELDTRTTSINRLNQEIAERLAVEHQLKESELKYRILVENANDAIMIIRNMQILFFNQRTKTMLQATDEALRGTFTQFIHPEDRAMVEGRHYRRLQGEKLESTYTIRMLKAQDEVIWVQLSAVRTEWHNKPAILCFARDVDQVRTLREEYQQAKKMEAIGTLAGGVAHDLNNILSGLVGYPEMLLLDLPADSPLRPSVEAIQQSGHKAAAIVQDLLTLARRGVVAKSAIDLNSVIKGYLQSPEGQQLLRDHPRIDFKTDLTSELLPIAGSEFHLGKVVMNLITNAMEAINGKGRVMVSTQNRYIDVPLQGYETVAEGDYIVLIVCDNGSGISSEDRQKIFEPFYTTKEMGRSGTGLGMAVVWGTVKDHQGYFDIDSQTDRGTQISVFFPVTRKEIDPESNQPALSDLQGRGESVLVVDDIKEQRDLAAMMLRRLNYAVTCVESGEKAVEVSRREAFDLVLLDMIMHPGIDGLETYRQLRVIHPDQRAIIASGFAATESVEAAKRMGVGAYVKKPYLIEQIGLAVKAELNRLPEAHTN
jgi:PAS domain S-box-containing protein